MLIGDNISQILRKRNIKTYKLAKELNIDVSGLYKLLRNKSSNPTIDTLIKLADYLDITLDELVGR
ncbi:helix-turn-helix domain-containing protein [Clostridioides sp. ZZV14-6044]|uniref:helix-turn-helix domain-containing protein n=1 Tax=unclassified Clostridioides TaxID=2635829 RepID=UPI001D1153B0|nr:helix-turn-helix transcriptional regulator [Clostridioides sp. ZZV14-6154]MCC0720821.1 helix-turn-helix transcriptional regulator [Clostridioides sp. ZZV14-6104]MCC0725257.1 helix-turn-helix transcriptional regulator [Clostridioides sp. ZZV14-6045]MCC0741370.1 helix-turn-helix transcriptional regulator [Clostridioides sp. ZZV14-6044]MCC0749551.1 helix-turn-helix transcriptional regulator [Clostridioides sp. ZZV13-5731]WLD28615.1 Cro/C1-type HTH DNA-binding domain protein [Clostridioides dif